MKRLVDYIKEDNIKEDNVNESMTLQTIWNFLVDVGNEDFWFWRGVFTIPVMIWLFEDICIKSNLSGGPYYTKNPIKSVIKNGLFTGIYRWILSIAGRVDLTPTTPNLRMLKEMGRKVKATPEWKEYVQQPKSKRTLKKLTPIVEEIFAAENINLRMFIYNLWEESKTYSSAAKKVRVTKDGIKDLETGEELQK